MTDIEMQSEIGIMPAPRVLIVDNDESAVELFENFLSIWGYTAVVAHGIGTDLVDDAILKAREHRCQLALVDMRLIDNFDSDDFSGLELIEKIKPAATIIASGYGTLEIALNCVEKGAYDFYEKGGNPKVLKEKLEKAAVKVCAFRRQWNVKPNEMLKVITDTLFGETLDKDFHDQVLDVLGRLFPHAEQLRLERVNSGSEGTGYSTAPRPRSVVMRVYEDDLEPVIVKMARATKIIKEVDLFQKYINHRLRENHAPVMEGHVELWDIGAIKFSYVGSIEETFGRFIFSQPVDKIQRSLEHFFTRTWASHYEKARQVEDVSLFGLYCDVWDRNWHSRAQTCPPPVPDERDENFWHQKFVQNPIEWLEKIAESEGSEFDRSLMSATMTAVTHGDLHSDNLLVDNNQNSWVVDFERCGEGHALQDFIELEFDVFTRITSARERISNYFDLCLAVATAQRIDESLPENMLFENETRKLLEIISIIRRLAVQCTGITDAREYMLGLFFNTIFRTTLMTQNRQDRSLQRLWMFANILCQRIEHWDETWPPAEWKRTSL